MAGHSTTAWPQESKRLAHPRDAAKVVRPSPALPKVDKEAAAEFIGAAKARGYSFNSAFAAFC